MKTQVHIDDYKLKIETEDMVVSIQLRKHEQLKEIFNMTKDLVELSIEQQNLKKTLNEIHEEEMKKKNPIQVHSKFKKGGTEKIKQTATRVCPICEKQFTPRTKRSTYCSDKCSSKGYNEKHKAKKKKSHAPGTMPHAKSKANYDPTVNPITGHKKD